MSNTPPPAPDTAARSRLRLLVTGAGGFLGRAMVHAATHAGHEVWRAGRSRHAATPQDRAFVINWESNPTELARTLEKISPDCIIHAAGSASVAGSLENPHHDLRASFGTWSHLLEAVRLASVKPLVIFPSSAAVYGDPETLPVQEDAPLRPISPYGWHKMLGEALAREYHAHFGVPVAIVRLFSVFGPMQRRLLVWELYDRFLREGHEVTIGGTGQETRDFLSQWDVCQALLQLAENRERFHCGDHLWTFNLASGIQRSILEVAQALGTVLNSAKNIRCLGERRPGDPLHWQACTERIASFLPFWKPGTFEDTLRQTVSEWREQTPQAS